MPRELTIGAATSSSGTCASQPQLGAGERDAGRRDRAEAAVAHLQRQPAPVAEADREHALGADLRHEPVLGAHQLGVDRALVGDELRVRAHRARATVAGRAQPAAGQRAERAGEPGERERERPHPAAVGGLLGRRLDAARRGDGVAHRALERMPGAEVAVQRPALVQAAGEPERVLARAVVADPRRPHVLGRPRVARQLRPAGERLLAQAAGLEHLADRRDVVRGAAVRRAGHRQVARPEPEALDDAGADAPQRLQRLDRGAREHRQLRVVAADRPVGVRDAPGDAVLGLDRPAPDRDDPRQEPRSSQRARLSSISCSASSRSYQPSTTTSLPSGCL